MMWRGGGAHEALTSHSVGGGGECFFSAEWRVDPLRGSVPGLLRKPAALIDPARQGSFIMQPQGVKGHLDSASRTLDTPHHPLAEANLDATGN